MCNCTATLTVLNKAQLTVFYTCDLRSHLRFCAQRWHSETRERGPRLRVDHVSEDCAYEWITWASFRGGITAITVHVGFLQYKINRQRVDRAALDVRHGGDVGGSCALGAPRAQRCSRLDCSPHTSTRYSMHYAAAAPEPQRIIPNTSSTSAVAHRNLPRH